MSKRKYQEGLPIRSVADFEKSNKEFFIVHFGNKPQTKHRAFLISWQYRVLKNFIKRGWIFEADRIEDREYERAVDDMEYDMRYEPTYNAEDGSM